MSFIRNYGIEQSIFEKCHRNITYSTPDFKVYMHSLITEKIEIIKIQTLNVIKKQFQNLIGLKAFRKKNVNENF